VRLDTCPTDETLAAFNLGDLPEEVLDLIREHQESCAHCEARARRLEDRTDSFIDDLRRTALGGVAPGETSGAVEGSPQRAGATPGRPVLPDYEVEEPPLGTGSMGVVYKARHLKLDRVVALKMIAGRSSRVSALFQIEAKAVAQLQHPNIVQIFEIGQHEGQPFLALEFVEGGSLDRKIAGRPQPPRQAAEMVRAVALAAEYAHRQGIVHCDLKPSNILLTPEGVPKIADFGVAKWLKSDDGWGEDGDVVGTPRYMAPEQASGSVESVGPATDVYSLGVLLYEMLTGRTPHHSATSLETLNLVREQEPVAPRQLQPRLSRDLETIVLKCLRKDPSRRYGGAGALAEDLGRFLAGDPIQARPVGRAERAYLRARRHPAIVGVLVAATLWITTYGLLQWRYQAMVRRFDADLKKVTVPESNGPFGKHPVLVAQADDGSVRLRALAATVEGESLALEPRFGNIGYWHGADDRALWTFRIDRPATFTLALDYSNANGAVGNACEVRVGETTLRARTEDTGAWSSYRSFPVGTLTLPAGVHRLEVRPSGTLQGALFDLRAVTLTPRT